MTVNLKNLQGSFSNLQKHFDLYSKFIKEGSFCLDIGTNCGSSTIPMILLHGKSGRTIGFEPNKIAFKYLENNLNQNNFSDYSDIYNLAIADKNGERAYIHSPSSDNGGFTDGFTIEERGSLIPSYNVECVNIKEFLISKYSLKDLKKITFIKIDCEGYDSEILMSLSDLLEIINPVIITEWWFDVSKNDKLFDSIQSIGYDPYRSDNFYPADRTQFKNKSEDLILISKNGKI